MKLRISVYCEFLLSLLGHLLFFRFQYFVSLFEYVFVRLELQSKTFQTLHKEVLVVSSREYRVLDIADKVFEECSDDDINYLSYL